ncbi:MAG: amino acid ABC transporter permease [Clostridia bacterium]|nr:amino acid ABC transporter permease [Clostridia bacterium]
MDNLGQQIYATIVKDDRWQLFLSGLGNTLLITLVAVVLGVLIGALVAIIKVNAVYNRRWKWLAFIGDIYTTIIRGTPVVVQLLIMYYIVFASAKTDMAVYVAALTFGINSGAYVSEIIRAGIMSIDRGQMEAGRSLGLSQGMTMSYIIFPQAIKNVLPALGNEVITLFKETSIVGYVAVADLTRVAEMIRSRTMSPFVPLIFIALIYLGIVMLLTWGLRKMETRLAQSDVR